MAEVNLNEDLSQQPVGITPTAILEPGASPQEPEQVPARLQSVLDRFNAGELSLGEAEDEAKSIGYTYIEPPRQQSPDSFITVNIPSSLRATDFAKEIGETPQEGVIQKDQELPTPVPTEPVATVPAESIPEQELLGQLAGSQAQAPEPERSNFSEFFIPAAQAAPAPTSIDDLSQLPTILPNASGLIGQEYLKLPAKVDPVTGQDMINPETGDIVRDETFPGYENKVNQIFERAGNAYDNGVIRVETDSGETQRRRSAIRSSVAIGVPTIENGQIKYGDDGFPVYEEGNYIEFDEGDEYNKKLVYLFEALDNPNGIYHIYNFNQDGQLVVDEIDINPELDALTKTKQSGAFRWALRYEDPDGGLAFRRDTLMSHGVTNPARILFYLRQQAGAGVMSHVERSREFATLKDIYPMIANFGLALPNVISDMGISGPIKAIQMLGPVQRFGREPTEEEKVFEKMPADAIARVFNNEIFNIPNMPQFEVEADRLAKEYGITRKEAAAILYYTPDATTAIKRFVMESVLTTPLTAGIVKTMGAAEARNFTEWFLKNYTDQLQPKFKGGQPPIDKPIEKALWEDTLPLNYSLDIREVPKLIEEYNKKNNKSVTMADIFQKYLQTRPSQYGKTYIEKLVNNEISARAAVPGQFRQEFFEQTRKTIDEQIARKTKEIDDLLAQKAITEAEEKVIRLRHQEIADLQEELLELTTKRYIPENIKNAIKQDIFVLSPAMGISYQLIYQATDGDESLSYLGAFVGGFASVYPNRFKEGTKAKLEDWKYALARSVVGDRAPSAAAIELRRRVRNAPPELREQIYLFMEDRIRAAETLSNIKFPKGHPREGQSIAQTDPFLEGFDMLSGVAAFRVMSNEGLLDTLKISTDVGKFSDNLERVNRLIDRQTKLLDEIAQVIDNLKYYKNSDLWDPKSPAGKLLTTLEESYKLETARVKQQREDLTAAGERLAQEKETLVSALARPETARQFMEGQRSLTHAIAVDLQKFREKNITVDMDPADAERLLLDHLRTVSEAAAKSFEAQKRYMGETQYENTANAQFLEFLRQREHEAYTIGSQKFNTLRNKYPDARFDITADIVLPSGERVPSIFDQLVDDVAELDDVATVMAIPILEQGSSMTRRYTGLDLDKPTNRVLMGLFERGAKEYFDTTLMRVSERKRVQLETFLEQDEIKGMPYWQKFVEWRKLMQTARDSSTHRMTEADYNELRPVIGVDLEEFMHIISSLGNRSSRDGKQSVAPAQLRRSLLNSAEHNFVNNFYAPRASMRTPVTNLSKDYSEAREFYRTHYMFPFRDDSRTVAQISRMSDRKADKDIFVLDRFVREMGLDKKLSPAEVEQRLVKTLRDLNMGRPITMEPVAPDFVGPPTHDRAVTQQINSIFTNLIAEEIAYSLAKEGFANALRVQGEGQFVLDPRKIKTVKDKDLDVWSRIRSGQVKGRAGLDITNFMDDIGASPRVFDEGGRPLYDSQFIDSMYSLDDYAAINPAAVKEAFTNLDKRITEIKNNLKTAGDEFGLDILDSVKTSRELLKYFDVQKGGVGYGVLNILDTERGIEKIKMLEEDFVSAMQKSGQITAEKPETYWRAQFNQVMQQRAHEAITDQVLQIGPKIADTIDTKSVLQTADIIPGKLAEILGYRGDTTSPSFKARQMRQFFGDEVYDHMVEVARFIDDSAPRRARGFSITGIYNTTSPQSYLSKAFAWKRGVVSGQYLLGEAAVRESLRSNFELVKEMMFNPAVGREVMELMRTGKFKPKGTDVIIEGIINAIAKNDLALEYAREALPGQDTVLLPTPTEADRTMAQQVGPSIDDQMSRLSRGFSQQIQGAVDAYNRFTAE